MRKYLLILLISLVSGLSSCSRNTPSEAVINAPDILELMNTSYSTATIAKQSDGYVYLKLSDNPEAYQQLTKLITKYVYPKDKTCFQFVHNRIGLHVTLATSSGDQHRWDNLIEKKIRVSYSYFYTITMNTHHSHNHEIVYAVHVNINPNDYMLFTEAEKQSLDTNTLHTTLALFRKDQDNECLIDKLHHALVN